MALEIKEVVSLIKSGNWLRNLTYITADLSKKKGGEIIVLKKCRIARKQLMEKSGAPTIGATSITRPANHNLNFTVNMELENGMIRKVHPVLITSINDTVVI